MFKIYKYVEEDIFDDKIDGEDAGDVPANSSDDFDDSLLDNDQENERGEDDIEGMGGEDSDEESPDEDDGDPDFQGVIRTVPGACLVYKRKTENNTYEELWIYNVGGRDIRNEVRIRNSILAGTDIDPKTQRSPEGDQVSDTITVGNVQFLEIAGLVN